MASCLPVLGALMFVVVVVDAAGPQLSVLVNRSSGGFVVSVDGDRWTASDSVRVFAGNTWFSTEDGTLTWQNSSVFLGSDALGKYSATRFDWLAPYMGVPQVILHTTVYDYTISGVSGRY